MERVTKDFVRKRYADIALSQQGGCGCSCGSSPASCCNEGSEETVVHTPGSELGYSQDELDSVPEGANLGLGCGNPQAIADLKAGEIVVDLGSGAGFDCFLAAKRVGDAGKVIGVDMTEAMIDKARSNAEKSQVSNVEFLLGEIENIPLPDNTADVVISNCVINLSLDKPKVFSEAYRILKPGGRLAVTDIVTRGEIPQELKDDPLLHSACISGASPMSDVISMMEEVGFTHVSVVPKGESKRFISTWAPGSSAEDYIVSAEISGIK